MLPPSALPAGLFTTVTAARVGLSPDALSRAVRSGRLRRLAHGVYLRSEVPLTVQLRLRAAELAVGSPLIASHETAAELWRVDVSPPARPEEGAQPLPRALARPGTRLPRGRVGVQVSTAPVVWTEVTRRDGIRVTRPARTALDLARERELAEAVVAVDAFLAAGRVTPGDLVAAAERMSGWRGIGTARRALELADRRAGSPMESRLRVLLALAGLTPVPQHEVRDGGGRLVARVDLAFPRERLAIEYDGRDSHLEPGGFLRDRHRQHDLRELDWEVLRFTGVDVFGDPAGVERRVRRFLELRRGRDDQTLPRGVASVQSWIRV